MIKKYSHLFHQHSKQIETFIPSDPQEWPDSWKKLYYKTYPRFPKVDLTAASPAPADLWDTLNVRKSQRDYTAQYLSVAELSLLLEYAVGEKKSVFKEEIGLHFPRRTYPSAGHRYPIEVYLCVDNTLEGVPSGVFHYDVSQHQLEMMTQPFDTVHKQKLFKMEWMHGASVVVYLAAVFHRSVEKYGERGYRFVLMEAGCILQNFYLISSALGLRCCAVGGSRGSDRKVEDLLDLDGTNESLVGKLLVGK